MTYDCFIFFNELDLLEIRLSILAPVVDKFVIVEANSTFQGQPKPWNFQDHAHRYSQWMNRIIYVQVEDCPRDDSWGAEYHQRNCIRTGLQDCEPNDTILIGDLDEIPDPAVVDKYRGVKNHVGLLMELYYYYLNVSAGAGWAGTKITPYSLLPKRVQDLREYNPKTQVHAAGWHWSFLGGADAISQKIQAFAHSEYNTEDLRNPEHIKDRVGNLKDVLGRDMSYRKVEIDESFPQYIRDNQERYRHLILS